MVADGWSSREANPKKDWQNLHEYLSEVAQCIYFMYAYAYIFAYMHMQNTAYILQGSSNVLSRFRENVHKGPASWTDGVKELGDTVHLFATKHLYSFHIENTLHLKTPRYVIYLQDQTQVQV